MTLCFSLFGRTPQVSQAEQSRKARKMLPPEAGLLWLWGRLLRHVPIFITSHMILPQREESQSLIGEWKFQVYSTCCKYQAILPSYSIFLAQLQFWGIHAIVNWYLVWSIILNFDEIRFSHWDEVLRWWFMTCWSQNMVSTLHKG